MHVACSRISATSHWLAYSDADEARAIRDDWTARATDAGFSPTWPESGADALVDQLRGHGFDVWKEPVGDVFVVVRACG
jgi:hypothetical protein